MNPRSKMMLMQRRRRNGDGTFRRENTFPYDSYTRYPDTMPYNIRRREQYNDRWPTPMNRSDYPDEYDPSVSPMYEKDSPMPLDRIGFALPSEFDPSRYGANMTIPHGDEMSYRKGEKRMGHASSDEGLSEKEAHEWVNKMKNADGTTGPHWNMEQTEQVMQEQKIQCDEVEFFVAMNMMYSDYCKVAKKHGCSTTEFYAAMAKAFLDDKDANPEKLTLYHEYIAK